MCVCVPSERVGHVADGEADDGRAPGAGQGHAQEPHSSGHADGLCPTGAAVPGEQVRTCEGLSVIRVHLH